MVTELLNEQSRDSRSEPSVAMWSDSFSICSLTDAERHLGHVVNASDCWIAFDATHLNLEGTGFAVLGTFPEISSAKRAVERTHRIIPAQFARHATQ